jgi:Concanavalin A-like lectin/glucanases superfamily
MTYRRPLLVALTIAATFVLFADPAYGATTVASWQMNDTGTVMTDSSGHGLKGTLKNVVPNGSAFTFQGTPSVVSVNHSALLNPGTGTFTVTVRLKFPAVPTTSVGDFDLIRKGLSGYPGGHWKVEISPSGRGYCQFEGSTGRVILVAGPNLANNAWHTIVCQRSGTTVRLTVDGTTYTRSGPTGTIANTSTLYIGAKSLSGGDQFTGVMDYVTITAG